MSEQPSYFDEAFDADQVATLVEPNLDTSNEEEITIAEESILQRGFFSTTVELGTNKIVIRTLKIGEELEAALVAQKYQETIEATRALITATIAASVVSVNGQPLITFPLGVKDESLDAKFNYITSS